ncbi:MAG TPA: T9SS type A sorting domain-containing protein [Bacteroidales bacterium]|nr:T9SS type A sorting domain-containing protein [Bacteroidales bacterium]
MKRIIYILVFILMIVKSAFSLYPNPKQIGSDFLDGDPELFKISAPVPNPVIDFAEIYYNLPDESFAEIAIYNFAGVKVKSLTVNGGESKVSFDTYDLQSGVYFVCLIFKGKNIDSKKLVKK